MYFGPIPHARGMRPMQANNGQLTLTLTDREAEAILSHTETGSERHLHRLLVDQLQGGGRKVTLNERQLGQLICLMTENGPESFQDRLRQAFNRPIAELLVARDRDGTVAYRN